MPDQELYRLQVGTVVYLAVVCVLIVAAPASIADPAWVSHVQILASDAATVRALDRYLSARGVAVVSAQRTFVEVQNFAGLERVRLADLPERLDHLDPRLDPFLRAVDKLFVTESGERRVLYAARAPDLARHLRAAAAHIGRDRLVVPDTATRFALVPASFHLLALLPLVAVASRRRVVVGAAGCCSLLLAGFWGAGAGAVSLAMLAPWTFAGVPRAVREQEWANYGRWYGVSGLERLWSVLTVAAACCGVTLAVLDDDRRIVVGVVAYAVGLAALRIAGRAAARRRSRGVILPRPILPRRAPEADLRRVALPLIVSALVLGSGQLMVTRVDSGSGPRVPTPLYLETLGGDPIDAPLSTAGYLAHRFFQQGIVYGADYRLPTLGEDLGIRRFRATDRGLTAFHEPKLAIDASWMQRQLNGTVGGLYALFTGTDRPFVVHSAPLRRPSRNDRIGAAAASIVLAVFALTVLAVRVSLRGERRLGRVERTLRRSAFDS